MLAVVIEAEMSIRIGSPSVGMPQATGSGVNTPVSPPNGATCSPEGLDDEIAASRPRSVASGRYAASAPMWCASPTTSVQVPCASARSMAVFIASSTRNAPGSRRPFQQTAAPRSDSTSGAPLRRTVPSAT